jgi:hypothetical protein
MIDPVKTADGWELVESANDDAGMPGKVLRTYTGRLAGLRCTLGFWAYFLRGLLR